MSESKKVVFATLRETKTYTDKLRREAISFTLRVITYRKRLRKPMQIEVTVYGL